MLAALGNRLVHQDNLGADHAAVPVRVSFMDSIMSLTVSGGGGKGFLDLLWVAVAVRSFSSFTVRVLRPSPARIFQFPIFFSAVLEALAQCGLYRQVPVAKRDPCSAFSS